jgi:hypothetical protein
MHTLLLAIFAFGIMVLNAHSSYAESSSPTFAIGLGLEVSSGTFGTGSTSTYVTAPVIIDWFPTERVDFELTVPLLYQKKSMVGSHATLGTSTLSSAKSVAKSVERSSMAGSGGSMFGGDYGLGDITLTSGYALLMDSDTSPFVRPHVYVKFPTAPESLEGTGKFDYGVGLSASKWLGNWQPFVGGRYVVHGVDLNYVIADAGLAYSWSDRFITSMQASFGSTQFEGTAAPLEARLKAVWRFGERTYTEAYALKGFSDGSPDYGGGISVFMEF